MPSRLFLVSPDKDRLSALVAFLACAAAACNSSTGAPPIGAPSTGAGGMRDAGAAEVGPLPIDATPSDAASPSPADDAAADAGSNPVDATQPVAAPQEAGFSPLDAMQPDVASNPADASRPDGARADAGPCPGGTFVCDDFERYGLGAAPSAPWTAATNTGTVAVDATRAYSGAHSVKVTAPAATGYRSVMLRIAGGGLLPVAGNAVYGRMMFWLDSSPSMTVHWTFVDGSGIVPGATAYHAAYRYGGQLPLTGADGGFLGSQLMASYDTTDSYTGVGPSTDCFQHSKGRPVPVGVWTCIEWQFDGPNDTTRFWLNGAAVPDLTVAHTGAGCVSQPAGYEWASPTISQLDVGWESYQADGARTMWIDDVAYGTTRIGCP